MFALRLASADCICCGICADYCAPSALSMRKFHKTGVEGLTATDGEFDTFPYLANASACNGCRDCVRECPVSAIQIVALYGAGAHPAQSDRLAAVITGSGD